MENINLQKLCSAIIRVANKAPLTYLSEQSILFRGERLEINGLTARSKRYEFNFNSVDSFIDNLKTYGLMLSYSEIERIMKYYRNGNGKTENNEA